MSLSIGDLDVNPRIITAVKNAGYHDGRKILNLPSAELERLTGLSAGDVTQLKDVIAQAVLGHRAITGLEMWKVESNEKTCSRRLSTGCPLLDQALRGGLLVGGITEIAGESAAGKTQLCLQLCLTVQLPLSQGGLDGGAFYICTEGAFPNKRLHQIAQGFSKQHSSVLNHCVTDRILLEHVADLGGLRECVQRKVGVGVVGRRVRLVVVDSVAAVFRCEQDSRSLGGLRECVQRKVGVGVVGRRVRLVVVDSVAAVFRCEQDSRSLVGRASQLAALATQLRALADHYRIPVVCVNQVTANMSRVCDGPGLPRQSIPALGLVWADHITCRLLMTRPPDPLLNSPFVEESCSERGTTDQTRSALISKRKLEVVFAPHLAQTVVPLVISRRGIGHESAVGV
ncbi:hypothetical protein ACOMHN_013146 [Nucella lapillus]